MSENQNLEALSKFISIGDSFINIQSIAHAQVDGNEITIQLVEHNFLIPTKLPEV